MTAQGNYQRFRDELRAALDERYYPIGWLDAQVASGKIEVFASESAILLVELRRYPGGAMDAHVMLAAGDRADIVNNLAEKAEAWAIAQGCTATEVESRPGWARALECRGYTVAQVKVRKEL